MMITDDNKVMIICVTSNALMQYSVKQKSSSEKPYFKKKGECKCEMASGAITLKWHPHPSHTWIFWASEDKSFGLMTTGGHIFRKFTIKEFGLFHADLSACGRWASVCGGMAI
eukprot:UN28101